MVIDMILDVLGGNTMCNGSIMWSYEDMLEYVGPEYQYDGEGCIYYVNPPTFPYLYEGFLSKDNKQIRKVLCQYVNENGHNQDLKRRINKTNWVII